MDRGGAVAHEHLFVAEAVVSAEIACEAEAIARPAGRAPGCGDAVPMQCVEGGGRGLPPLEVL